MVKDFHESVMSLCLLINSVKLLAGGNVELTMTNGDRVIKKSDLISRIELLT